MPPDTLQSAAVSVDYNALARSGSVREPEGIHQHTARPAKRRSSFRRTRGPPGQWSKPGRPSPMFADLARRLRVAGHRSGVESDKLIFRKVASRECAQVGRPVKHPWLHGMALDRNRLTGRDGGQRRSDLYKPDMWMDPTLPLCLGRNTNYWLRPTTVWRACCQPGARAPGARCDRPTRTSRQWPFSTRSSTPAHLHFRNSNSQAPAP